jgi:hypothetical protein
MAMATAGAALFNQWRGNQLLAFTCIVCIVLFMFMAEYAHRTETLKPGAREFHDRHCKACRHDFLSPGLGDVFCPECGHSVDGVTCLQDWEHYANEWADAATTGVVWLRNIRHGLSTPEEAEENMRLLIEHAQSEHPRNKAVKHEPKK